LDGFHCLCGRHDERGVVLRFELSSDLLCQAFAVSGDLGHDDVLFCLRFVPDLVGPFCGGSLGSWQAVHHAFRGDTRFKLLLKFDLSDFELLDDRVLVEAAENVEFHVSHRQNLSIHRSRLVVAVSCRVGSVFLKLAHELLVELGKLEPVVEE